eukprot:gnl/TRDRNA2_/TRDRNA2_165062_c1_seq1.p1 gnl/TRDRNA2_/TRDRNA2_165062_c1~~gnl/TRDRNA2_/TRDRNA2_165062_c1_seq1.p1  ORF type:complete len:666 (+),score=112.35 gnl/TRDRNA2_/TRDRNA2_165062_c1_seq1:128-1999(+)
MHVVQDLVRRKCSPNMPDVAGWTPLHVAVCMGRQDVSLYLLQSGAMLKKNIRGQTPTELCSHPGLMALIRAHEAQLRIRPAEAAFPRRAPSVMQAQEGSLEGAQGCRSLHFEPFFVPRSPLFHLLAHREEFRKLGAVLFNRSPGHGLAFLVASGTVRDYPVEINSYLLHSGTDPRCLGDMFGDIFPIAQTLRLEYINSLPLLGTGVLSMLETAFREIQVPFDMRKVDRLTSSIAYFWWQQHEDYLLERRQAHEKEQAEKADAEKSTPDSLVLPEEVSDGGLGTELAGHALQRRLLGTEGLHRLAFSTLMLLRFVTKHREVDGKALSSMSLDDWIDLNTGMESNGSDVPVHVQACLYHAVIEGKLVLGQKTYPAVPILSTGPRECKALVNYCVLGGSRRVAGTAAPQEEELGRECGPESKKTPMPEITSPRVFAAQGGAPTTGRSLPSPPPGGFAVPIDANANSATSGQLYGEMVWLALCRSLLLISSGPLAAPYAMVYLHQTKLRAIDPSMRRVHIASQRSKGQNDGGPDRGGWLELCLLLGDARFQRLEVPELLIQFESDAEFEGWSKHLREICRSEPFRFLAKDASLRQEAPRGDREEVVCAHGDEPWLEDKERSIKREVL